MTIINISHSTALISQVKSMLDSACELVQVGRKGELTDVQIYKLNGLYRVLKGFASGSMIYNRTSDVIGTSVDTTVDDQEIGETKIEQAIKSALTENDKEQEQILKLQRALVQSVGLTPKDGMLDDNDIAWAGGKLKQIKSNLETLPSTQ